MTLNESCDINLAGMPIKTIADVPFLLEVQDSGANASAWAERYSDDVQTFLAERGALLIRGLRVHGSEQFGKILSTLFGSELLEYTYRSTPRTALRGNVYTATEYPASQVIPQHNENSYARTWPNRIGFLCLVPPQSEGETPIGSSRKIYESLPSAIREKFETKGVMYVRNYSTIDLPWSEVFQTSDKAKVEEYCFKNGLKCTWTSDDGLRTTQVNPATAIHPVSGEVIWFNQAHLFHYSSLRTDIAATLIDNVGENNLPRNVYFGDGSPIDLKDLEIIRQHYERTKIKFPWKKSDLLLLDNMLFTHGREAYTGPRKILTGMACPNVPLAATEQSQEPPLLTGHFSDGQHHLAPHCGDGT